MFESIFGPFKQHCKWHQFKKLFVNANNKISSRFQSAPALTNIKIISNIWKVSSTTDRFNFYFPLNWNFLSQKIFSKSIKSIFTETRTFFLFHLVRDVNSIELNRFDIYLFEISSSSMFLSKSWKSSSDKNDFPCSAVRECEITEKILSRTIQKIETEMKKKEKRTNNFLFYSLKFFLRD